MPNLRTRTLVISAAVLGAAALSGCAAWKIGTSSRLAKEATPFETSPAGATRSLLVIGDSTAVGTGASASEHSLPGLIAARDPGLRVVNKAENGARYADFARQLEATPGRFDAVLVLGGGNDVIRFTDEERLLRDVKRVAELARQRGTRVILMPPGNVGNAPFFFRPYAYLMDSRSRMLHAEIREAAAQSGAAYVNLYKDRKSDPFAQRPRELHAPDGLHPSDEGYALWLDEFTRQMQAFGNFLPVRAAQAPPAPLR